MTRLERIAFSYGLGLVPCYKFWPLKGSSRERGEVDDAIFETSERGHFELHVQLLGGPQPTTQSLSPSLHCRQKKKAQLPLFLPSLSLAAAAAARQRTTTISLATAPPTQTLMEEQANDVEGGRNQQIPEDGHTWKKYGQKFIRSIQKIRCYFKCQRATCIAKKKVEWPPTDPSNLIVTYEGHHNHQSNSGPRSSSSQQDGSDPRVNDYNLLSQVLGATNNCS